MRPKHITVVYPWGNPFSDNSGGSGRVRTLIKLIKSLRPTDTITIEGVNSRSFLWMETSINYLSLGRWRGLLLDIFPYYYLRRANSEGILILSGPLGIFGALFSKRVLKRSVFIIYDAHNVERERMKSGAFSTKTSILKLLTQIIIILSEFFAVKYSDCIVAISHRDKKMFREVYGTPLEKIKVVYPTIEPTLSKNTTRHPGVLFHGSFKYLPNREALEVLIGLSKRLPWVKFYIAGSGTPKGKRGNFTFLGFVENLDDFLKRGDLAVIPLKRGAGVKLKIIDYLRKGIPVVTTPIGAQGLEFINKKNAVVVEIHDIEREVRFLVEHPKYKRRLGLLGKRHAERLLSLKHAKQALRRCINHENQT